MDYMRKSKWKINIRKEVITMAVLVAGGAGYIGSHTAIELFRIRLWSCYSW